MLFKSTLLAIAVTALATFSAAKQIEVLPDRAATIYHGGPCESTCEKSVACPQCNYGDMDVVSIIRQLRVYSSALLNFNIPGKVRGCYLAIPPHTKDSFVASDTTLTVYTAETSDWNEVEVTGRNAPKIGREVASQVIGDGNQVIDISSACGCVKCPTQDVSIYIDINQPYYARFNGTKTDLGIKLLVDKE
ncbi:hypothetical protein EV182_001134 [Spiromyces aspiralis]|uniref:Uncharacterized protein n=1 Tax=Spiromyces aspiralis TaxID=68401 RepID=A0ACC1HTW5_9FUNG|nr:hypothetical protein EV182_001134 [Spiromyces aspiralis]